MNTKVETVQNDLSNKERQSCLCFKVCVKSFQRIVCKHIINVRNILQKHVTKPVNYVVLLNREVKPLVFHVSVFKIIWEELKQLLSDALQPPRMAPPIGPWTFPRVGVASAPTADTLPAFENRESALFFQDFY